MKLFSFNYWNIPMSNSVTNKVTLYAYTCDIYYGIN